LQAFEKQSLHTSLSAVNFLASQRWLALHIGDPANPNIVRGAVNMTQKNDSEAPSKINF